MGSVSSFPDMDQVQYDSLAPFDILDVAKVNSKALLTVLLEHFNLYGFDINSTDSEGNSLLHIGVYHENVFLISKAIRLGANINQLNEKKQTPLHVAADRNKPEAARLLLSCKAIQNIVDDEDETPVFKAVRKGHIRVLKVFIETRGDVKSANFRSETLLHIAASKGYLEIVELLLKSGLKKDARDLAGLTPLQAATENCCRQVVSLLIKSGADASVVDVKKRTLLHFAVRKNDPRLVKTLIDHKLNVNAQDAFGSTPLHWAIEFGMVNIALLLLRCRARYDISDEDGYTALHVTAKALSLAITVLPVLLSKGADIYKKTFNGDTCIHVAAFAGNLDGVKQLVKAKGDVFLENRDRYTPAHLAQQCGHLEIAEFLQRYCGSVTRRLATRTGASLSRSNSASRAREEHIKRTLRSDSMLSLIPKKTKDGMRRSESLQVLSFSGNKFGIKR